LASLLASASSQPEAFEVVLSAEPLENRNPTRQRGMRQDQIFLAHASGYEKKRNFKTRQRGMNQDQVFLAHAAGYKKNAQLQTAKPRAYGYYL
jgi:hypothetical protein